MNLQGRKVIIFDFDGVLFDTDNVNRTILSEIIDDLMGQELTDVDYDQYFFGRSLSDGVRLYLEHYQKFEFIDQIIERKKGSDKRYLALITPYADILDFIHEYKKQILGKEITLCIASNARRAQVEGALDKFEMRQFFTHIITASDVPPETPKSFIYRQLVQELGMMDERDKIAVIEDSQAGIEAATANGLDLYVIAITHTRDKDTLRGYDAIVDSLTDLSFSGKEQNHHTVEDDSQ